MIALINWWQLDQPAYPGARCLTDAAAANCPDESARAIGRLCVLQAAAAALGNGEPAPLQVAAVPYLAALFEIDDAETVGLWDCIASVRSNDTARLAASLYESARMCASRSAAGTARSFAELSYEAALASGAWEHAHYAALLLERLAELDECHEAADEWARRAQVYARRMGRRKRTRRLD